MNLSEKTKEITELINNLKDHSDLLSEYDHIPELELTVILKKVTTLHEKTLILKYLTLNEKLSEESAAFVKANDQSVVDDFDVSSNSDQIEVSNDETAVDNTVAAEYLNNIAETENTEAEKFEDLAEGSIDENTTDDYIVANESEINKVEVLTQDSSSEVNQEEEEREEEPPNEPELLLEDIEQNEEIDSKPDLNEVFSSEEDPSLSEQLKKQPITDLLTAIGLNERYLYANELFDGDMEDFRRVISVLNDFENESEVVEFFEKDLELTYNWEKDNELVKALKLLVRRRYP